MKKKYHKILIISCIFIIIAFIPIFPSQPYMIMTCKNREYNENNVNFILEQEESTINLKKDHYFVPLIIGLNILTDENISNVVMKSYSLKFNELNIEFNNNNHHKQVLIDHVLYRFRDNKYNYEKQFVLDVSLNELEYKMFANNKLNNLKKSLKNVKTAEYRCNIIYEIDNNTIENEILYIFNVKVKSGNIYLWQIIIFMIMFALNGGQT